MVKLGIFVKFKPIKAGVYLALVEWWDMEKDELVRHHSREYSLMSLSAALRQCLEREVRDARAEGHDDIFVYCDEDYSTLKKTAKKLGVKYYGWEADELDAKVRRMKLEFEDDYDDMEDMEEYAEYE